MSFKLEKIDEAWGIVDTDPTKLDFRIIVGENGNQEEEGMKVTTKKFSQFANRWRLANSFRGINVEEYSPNTVKGYNAVTKNFLAFTALERFTCLLSPPIQNWYEIPNLGTNQHADKAHQIILSLDSDFKFVKIVRKRLSSSDLKGRLTELINGDKKEVFSLSAGLRHLFAHGKIGSKISGTVYPKIAERVAECLLCYMDDEISRRVSSAQSV